jgi:hypothetical protein
MSIKKWYKSNMCFFLAGLLVAGCSSKNTNPEVRWETFNVNVLNKIDLVSVVTWAKDQLNSTNENGFIFSPAVYPQQLSKLHPIVVQIQMDTQTGFKFIFVGFKLGIEREGIMIGSTEAKINNYGYRRQLTNGVYYVYDTN